MLLHNSGRTENEGAYNIHISSIETKRAVKKKHHTGPWIRSTLRNKCNVLCILVSSASSLARQSIECLADRSDCQTIIRISI